MCAICETNDTTTHRPARGRVWAVGCSAELRALACLVRGELSRAARRAQRFRVVQRAVSRGRGLGHDTEALGAQERRGVGAALDARWVHLPLRLGAGGARRRRRAQARGRDAHRAALARRNARARTAPHDLCLPLGLALHRHLARPKPGQARQPQPRPMGVAFSILESELFFLLFFSFAARAPIAAFS